ncbi:MAG: ABC transporter permease subunit [Acidimicrobiia bacterium]
MAVWQRRRPGWVEVARKEMTDHLLSGRFIALLFILGLVAVGTVYGAASGLRDSAQSATEAGISVFLRLFTVNADPIPFSFMTFLGFLLPAVGIAYGFDSISGERSRGTLPRLVSQPIHRDDVINGKFVAGLAVIGVTLTVVVMIVSGIGILSLGVVPQVSDIFRLFTWLIASVVYVGVWLALAMLASVMFRNAATSAIVTIGIWLALTIFGGLLFTLVANVVSPIDAADQLTELSNARAELAVSRLSPVTLYNESSTALLVPEVRVLGFVTMDQIDRAIVSELSFTQSVLLVWPQLVAMLAITVSLFAIAYVKFMRQEVRA